MSESGPSLPPSPRDFHLKSIDSLLAWGENPGVRIKDVDYEKNTVSKEQQNNKYRVVWFNNIFETISLMVEDGFIADEDAATLNNAVAVLAQEIKELQITGADIEKKHVERGNEILKKVRGFLF